MLAFFLGKTRKGLNLRAVGESPATADAAGINVTVYKYCLLYTSLCRKSLEEIENFTEKLDKESRKEFQNVLDTYLELTYLEKRQSFCDGFRIGAGVMCEIFHGRSVRSNL